MGFFDTMKEIGEANKSSEPREHFIKQIEQYLLPGEVPERQYVNANDMAIATNKRLILLDKSWASSKNSVFGIPYSKINAVGISRGGAFSMGKEVEIMVGSQVKEFTVPNPALALELYQYLSIKIAP